MKAVVAMPIVMIDNFNYNDNDYHNITNTDEDNSTCYVSRQEA